MAKGRRANTKEQPLPRPVRYGPVEGIAPMGQGISHHVAHGLGVSTQPLLQHPPLSAGPDAAGQPLASSRGFRTVLSNPFFLRLWIAQLLSQTVMNASNYGLILLIATQSRKVTFTSLAIVAFALPAALLAAPAGVIVDRFDRRLVLLVSNVLRAIASVGFVVSLLIDQSAIAPVLALSFFTAAVGQFFAPAEGAAIPQLVHRDELVNALALFNITFTLAQALGLIVLGPLVLAFLPTIHIGTAQHGFDLLAIEVLFIVVAVVYAICALLILAIPARRLRRRHVDAVPASPLVHTGRLSSIGTGIMESWRYIQRDLPLANSVFQLCLGGTTVAVIATVAPSFVEQFFQLPQKYAALVFFPAALGLVLGSVVTPTIIARLRYVRTLTLGIILLGVSAALLTLARAVARAVQPSGWSHEPLYLGLALALVFVLGVALDLVNVPAQTRLQERTPDQMKGRVLALQGMALNALTVPAVILIGFAADFLGLPAALDILAVVIVATGLASIYLGSRKSSTPGLPEPLSYGTPD